MHQPTQTPRIYNPSHSYPPLAPRTCLLRRWRRHLQPRILRHHPLEPNTDSLYHGQQYRTPNSAIPYRPRPASHSQRASGEETSNNSVPRILFLSYAFGCAVEGAEETSPNAEVAAEDGCASFDCGYCCCITIRLAVDHVVS